MAAKNAKKHQKISAPDVGQGHDAPLTVAQFCKRYSVSRSAYYRLRALGEMPRETVISPRVRVILAASVREWERHRLESGDP